MNKVTIVMYHYVRTLKNSKYPEIKALERDLFIKQLEYFSKHYQIITMELLLRAIDTKEPLPKRALLLTFDDGYRDHYDFVFPILKQFKVQGSFFPPAKAILQHDVLDVNKIHFILATAGRKETVLDEIFLELEQLRDVYHLETESFYRLEAEKGYARFDSLNVHKIKGLLQRLIPEVPRSKIVDRLFKRHVTEDISGFSQELYLNVEQLEEMRHQGMFIGSHGFNHYWLEMLSEKKQIEEVEQAFQFLNSIGSENGCRVFCYPYGSYNQTLLEILKNRGCTVGLTTKVDIANLRTNDGLTLPRLDTNDLPKDPNAGINQWTTAAE